MTTTETIPPALERVADWFDQLRAAYPDLETVRVLEMALDTAQVTLVDDIGSAEDTDLERALRQWLSHTRAVSGAFGQSMENTMAVHADRELRSAAAKVLRK